MKQSVIFLLLFFSLQTWGQDVESEVSKLTPYIESLRSFSKYIPQEKVYLHFDNTSYYQGDNIWFKCYVTSGQNQLSMLSKTLYVELLNPGGEVVDKRILKIENGQCHGDFSLNHLPFYSGFYEVRAYTKYMLNFGDDVIFSRLFPVFDKPKTEGAFEEKNMLGYGRYGPLGGRPMKRELPVREKAVNLRFFPEGGNLIQGVTSRVAFEATDEAGNPIDVTGVVVDANKQVLSQITTLHEGRGVFTYTPAGSDVGRRRDIAEVEYSGRKYQFDMPASLPEGVIMEVDNRSYSDSIEITLRKNINTPALLLGVSIVNGGKLQNYCLAYIADDEITFKMDKTRLPSGVSQIVLFNSRGEILCDRLIFSNKNENKLLKISVKTNKPAYRPHELVDVEISLADGGANPVNATFSLSVRDGSNEVESKNNILTDLLLMSEIKGYVRNPSYYFEEKNDTVETRHAAFLLDLLLMVQGWRRYSWSQMAGVETFELNYLPEQGIETAGRIVSLVRQRAQPNVDVGLFLLQREDDEKTGGNFIETFVTDNNGRFTFVSDVDGRWNMILTVSEKGKRKDHRILLDRVFTPEPRRYRYADLQVNIAEKIITADETSEDFEDYFASFLAAYQDSLAKSGIDEQVHQLTEVTVRGRRNNQAQNILRNRSSSIAYYDVASEYDDIYDRGKYIGNDIHQLLINMNEYFSILYRENYEFLMYKGKAALFVIDFKPIVDHNREFFDYKNIDIKRIKSIYINETSSAKCQYSDPRIECILADSWFGCIVFIETYPDEDVPTNSAKGVRKTWLEGYSSIREFYSPNYSEMQPAPDYRRTLYWNPSVTTDETGKAKIQFYNNSRSTNFSISAETVTSLGIMKNVEADTFD